MQLIAFVTSLIFAFSNTFWSQAVSAEVYTLNAFFVILTLYILFLCHSEAKPKNLYLFSFVYGLSLTNHNTVLLFVPIYVFSIIAISKNNIYKPEVIMKTLIFFIIGLSVYLYLPMRASTNPIMNWGNPSNLENFIKHVSRIQYGSLNKNVYSFTLFCNQVFAYLKLLFEQFTPYLLVFGIIIIGIILSLRAKRIVGQASRHYYLIVLLLFIVSIFGFIILLNFSTTPKELYTVETFFTPSYLFFSVFIGIGLNYLLLQSKRINLIQYVIPAKAGICLLFFFPLLPLFVNYSQNNLSKNYIAYDYGKNILKTIGSNGANLFVSGDNATFIMAYLQMVEGRGRNVSIYDESGTVFPNIYGKDVYNLPKKEHDVRIETIQRKFITETNNPTYYVLGSKLNNMSGILSKPEGIIYKCKDSATIENIWELYETRGIIGTYKDYLVRDIISQYYVMKGEYFYFRNEKENAIKEFTKAENVAYDIETIQSILSDIYLKYGMTELALRKSIREADVNAGSADSHNNLGNAYLSKGMLDKAIEEYNLAIKINKKFAEAFNNLGLSYMEKGVFAQAIGAFKNAIDIQPNNSKFFNNIGIAYARNNDFENANISYKKAIEISPNYDAAHYNLGNLYFAKGLYDNAMDEYNKTIGITPNKPEVYCNLGLCYLKKKTYNSAIGAFEKAIKLKPDYVEAYYNLGNVYGNNGELKKAIEFWNKALELDKNYMPAKVNIDRARKLK